MSETQQDTVIFRKHAHIAVLTLNRPQVMNAVNRSMWMAAANAIEEFAHDPSLHVLIITGAGDRSFCSGSDLKEKVTGDMNIPDEMAHWGYAGIVRHFVNKPVIAAVNGYALGGGTEIALSCDLIIASEHATFGLPEASHGLLAGAGGLLRLPRQIPLKIAMNCILTGASLSATDALHWGLVNHVVPQSQLMASAMQMATKICECSPVAISASKEVVYRGLDQTIEFPGDAWNMNDHYISVVESSADAQEGMSSFLEKRKPVWKN